MRDAEARAGRAAIGDGVARRAAGLARRRRHSLADQRRLRQCRVSHRCAARWVTRKRSTSRASAPRATAWPTDPSGPVFVPYALAGRARAGRRARRARAPHRRHRTEPGAHRAGVPPLHPLRRLRRAASARARLSRLEARTGRRGVCRRAASTRRSATWRPSALGARRRASFSARRTGRGVMLGFHEAKGVEIVDLQECPVTASAIVRALPGLAPPGRAADVAARAGARGRHARRQRARRRHRGRAGRSVARGARVPRARSHRA